MCTPRLRHAARLLLLTLVVVVVFNVRPMMAQGPLPPEYAKRGCTPARAVVHYEKVYARAWGDRTHNSSTAQKSVNDVLVDFPLCPGDPYRGWPNPPTPELRTVLDQAVATQTPLFPYPVGTPPGPHVAWWSRSVHGVEYWVSQDCTKTTSVTAEGPRRELPREAEAVLVFFVDLKDQLVEGVSFSSSDESQVDMVTHFDNAGKCDPTSEDIHSPPPAPIGFVFGSATGHADNEIWLSGTATANFEGKVTRVTKGAGAGVTGEVDETTETLTFQLLLHLPPKND